MDTALMPAGLTAKQLAVLRFIARTLDNSGGVSPTFKEIAAGVALISKSQVARLVEALILRGYLQQPPRQRARALQLTTPGWEWWRADCQAIANKRFGRMPPAPVCPACGCRWVHDRAGGIFRPTCECEDIDARPAVAA